MYSIYWKNRKKISEHMFINVQRFSLKKSSKNKILSGLQILVSKMSSAHVAQFFTRHHNVLYDTILLTSDCKRLTSHRYFWTCQRNKQKRRFLTLEVTKNDKSSWIFYSPSNDQVLFCEHRKKLNVPLTLFAVPVRSLTLINH